jgi:hypothetical protein
MSEIGRTFACTQSSGTYHTQEELDSHILAAHTGRANKTTKSSLESENGS